MHAIKALWKNGRILPSEPVDWPEGSELTVETILPNGERVGLTEEGMARRSRVHCGLGNWSPKYRTAGVFRRGACGDSPLPRGIPSVQPRSGAATNGRRRGPMIRRYLLDTGIAQDSQEDRNNVRDRAIAERKLGHRVGICVPVLGELGLEWSAARAENAM
jgi:hypothetical protein